MYVYVALRLLMLCYIYNIHAQLVTPSIMWLFVRGMIWAIPQGDDGNVIVLMHYAENIELFIAREKQ